MCACLAVVISAVLGGCASAEHRGVTPARMAPDLDFVIPCPQELGRYINVVQLVTARYRDRTFVFEGLSSASPERLQLIALDSFGRRALSIVWDGIKSASNPRLGFPTP